MALNASDTTTPSSRTPATQPAAPPVSAIDPDAPLLFVVNARSGHNDPDQTRGVIEDALHAAGRRAEFLAAAPERIASTARDAAARSLAERSAVVAVGGDGTISTVARAVHAAGAVMGLIPQGTFNLFARTHGIALDAAEATQALLHCRTPQPVQAGLVNDQLFIANASLGLYPEALEDREAHKRRFGRHRIVGVLSTALKLLTWQHQLRLSIDLDGVERTVRTRTLFVGNNRYQLERLGLPVARALDQGSLAAVMLKPASTLALLALLLRGAIGTLGDADTIETFDFQHMTVGRRPRWRKKKTMKIAFDGEVTRMRVPLEFRVAPEPLYLLRPPQDDHPKQPAPQQP